MVLMVQALLIPGIWDHDCTPVGRDEGDIFVGRWGATSGMVKVMICYVEQYLVLYYQWCVVEKCRGKTTM